MLKKAEKEAEAMGLTWKVALIMLASIILTAVLLAGGGAVAAGIQGSGDERATAALRREHAELRAALIERSNAVAVMSSMGEAERGETWESFQLFLTGTLRPHAEWEEQVLYPEVDRRAGGSPDLPFTESMRSEHRTLKAWIDEITRMPRRRGTDIDALVRRADRLVGAVLVHFEAEEEVLLPVLDRSMSREEFDRSVRRKFPHPGRPIDDAILRRGHS